jgi:hypothetical protein
MRSIRNKLEPTLLLVHDELDLESVSQSVTVMERDDVVMNTGSRADILHV